MKTTNATPWKEEVLAEWSDRVRISCHWLRPLEDGEHSVNHEDELVTTFDRDKAVSTVFTVTTFHPIDGHEFGLQVNISEVCDEMDAFVHAETFGAIDDYMKDHPDGKDE
jgi:hypothetical protein